MDALRWLFDIPCIYVCIVIYQHFGKGKKEWGPGHKNNDDIRQVFLLLYYISVERVLPQNTWRRGWDIFDEKIRGGYLADEIGTRVIVTLAEKIEQNYYTCANPDEFPKKKTGLKWKKNLRTNFSISLAVLYYDRAPIINYHFLLCRAAHNEHYARNKFLAKMDDNVFSRLRNHQTRLKYSNKVLAKLV